MSEFCWARITIGGSIKEPLIPELIDLLKAEELISPDEDLSHYINYNNLLSLESNEASSGEYKEVERWLQDHDIPYIRISDGVYDDGKSLPARTVYWIPGMEKGGERVLSEDPDGDYMIHVGELEWILDAMESIGSIKDAPKFISHGSAHEQTYAAYVLSQAKINPIGYLKKYLKDSYTVPDLPPFKIS